MLDSQVLFAKKVLAVTAVAVFVFGSCKKENSSIINVPQGNAEQLILTVNGKAVTENQTDGKLGAYLQFNPQATEDEIRGARKLIAQSIVEEILVDEKLQEKNAALTEADIRHAERCLEFFFKDAGWVKKTAQMKNISEAQMYRDNLLEYKKMKLLALQSDIEQPTETEIGRFSMQNSGLYGEKPLRKDVYQILVYYKPGDESSLKKAKKRLEKARIDLQINKNFSETALKYSDLTPEEASAYLGAIWEACDYYGESVTEIVWALEAGECSEIYEGEYGACSVFYVKEVFPQEKLSEEEMYLWSQMLLILQKNENRYYRMIDELFENAEIIYSKEYDVVAEM